MSLDLSILGWLHAGACLLAILVGARNFLAPKGTRNHRLAGQVFLIAMVIVNLTALGIYRHDRFFFPHWLAVATLALITIAFASARWKRPQRLWLHVHVSSVVLSFYMLIGGGVNEIFLRVNVLRPFILDKASPAVGMTHLILILGFLVALGGFNIIVARRQKAAG